MNNYEVNNVFKTETKETKKYTMASEKQSAYIAKQLRDYITKNIKITRTMCWGVVEFDITFPNSTAAKRVDIHFEIVKKDDKIYINIQNGLLSWIARGFIEYNGLCELYIFDTPTIHEIRKVYNGSKENE